ncbi:hypothetical protein ENKNEFLB_01579 [Nocardioides aquaticus]|uniref:Uncharacterized protein n=1 Tax=Nocardioides aquaticus TaxID=160826 RepID=A0ABX8EFC4_9ACTN|nr:hypothetical protein [Nocardioides aquaticus]QVT79198.1 hypothetical protein ENKNEFLB_01579 [Nocardioides aquaticus]
MMGVHSPQVDALEGGMRTCTALATLPFDAGDPEWVADLLDTMSIGDLDTVIDQLDELLRLMRRAAKARRILATVHPELIRAGLQVRASRGGGS